VALYIFLINVIQMSQTLNLLANLTGEHNLCLGTTIRNHNGVERDHNVRLPKEKNHWTLTTRWEKLVKIGAKVAHHGRGECHLIISTEIPLYWSYVTVKSVKLLKKGSYSWR